MKRMQMISYLNLSWFIFVKRIHHMDLYRLSSGSIPDFEPLNLSHVFSECKFHHFPNSIVLRWKNGSLSFWSIYLLIVVLHSLKIPFPKLFNSIHMNIYQRTMDPTSPHSYPLIPSIMISWFKIFKTRHLYIH